MAVDGLMYIWQNIHVDQVYAADSFGVIRSGARWLTMMSLGWALARWRRTRPRSLLDNTLIIWTNELGKGNSHTLDNIPFLLLGGGFGFKMGRSVKFEKVPHNRLHLALAHAVGHRVATFGKPDFCSAGPLGLG